MVHNGIFLRRGSKAQAVLHCLVICGGSSGRSNFSIQDGRRSDNVSSVDHKDLWQGNERRSKQRWSEIRASVPTRGGNLVIMMIASPISILKGGGKGDIRTDWRGKCSEEEEIVGHHQIQKPAERITHGVNYNSCSTQVWCLKHELFSTTSIAPRT